MHICRVGLALDDIQDADVAAGLAGCDGYHAILGLEESAHDIEDGSFAHSLCLCDGVSREWRVGRDQEVGPRSGNQRGNDTYKIIMHVARVPKSGRRC